MTPPDEPLDEPDSESRKNSRSLLRPAGTSAPWIQRIVAGQGTATDWDSLFRRYREPLVVYTIRLCSPKTLAFVEPEDIVQQAWLDVIGRIDMFEYRGRGTLLCWLRLQIRRRLADCGRSRRERFQSSGESVEEASSTEAGPMIEFQRSEVRTRLITALEALPRTYREVVAARYLEGRAVITIARALGRKPATVSQQIRRGLALWREAFGEDPRLELSA